MRKFVRLSKGWFDRLPTQAAAKIRTAIARMEAGNLANVKGVGEGVLERTIDWGPGYRIYFGPTATRWSSSSEGAPRRSGGRHQTRQGVLERLPRPESEGVTSMPLTRDFKETVQARARRDAGFRKALLREALDCMLAGDVETGKIVLRDYINATVGFEELAGVTHKSPKSLMRMLGPSGNPQASNLFEIVAYLQKNEGLRLTTRAARR